VVLVKYVLVASNLKDGSKLASNKVVVLDWIMEGFMP